MINRALKEGDRVKVKRDWFTSHNGLLAHNRQNPHDSYLMPGEIGTVIRIPYTAWDGSPMAHWVIEFERGRRVSLEVQNTSYVDAKEAWPWDRHAHHMVLVRK